MVLRGSLNFNIKSLRFGGNDHILRPVVACALLLNNDNPKYLLIYSLTVIDCNIGFSG